MKVYVLLVTWFSVLTVVPCQFPRGGRRTSTTTSAPSTLPSLNLRENLLQINEIIDRINNQQALWTAGKNFEQNTTFNDLVELLGVEWSISSVLFLRKLKDPNWPSDSEIPEFFDARQKWKNCTVIGEILDQSQCGSCWAMAPAQVATDRYCIASGGRHNIRLSTQEVLDCTLMRYRRGCKGGMPAEAYQFLRKHGLVSGGTFGSEEGCQPYFMPKCAHHGIGPFTPCSQTPQKVPICKTKCTNDKYPIPFSDDIRKFNSIYKLGTNEKWIQKDIMTHGPISTQFQVHEDFFLYKSGVYEPLAALFVTPQGLPRGHTLKIIGWGTEKGVPYWLCVNSWNEHWGDRGLVKMRRRSPLLLLELLMYSTLPTVDPKFFAPQYQPQRTQRPYPPTERPLPTFTGKPSTPPAEKPLSTSTEKPPSPPTGKPPYPPTEKSFSTPTKKPLSPLTEKPSSAPTEKPLSNPTEKPISTPTQKPLANLQTSPSPDKNQTSTKSSEPLVPANFTQSSPEVPSQDATVVPSEAEGRHDDSQAPRDTTDKAAASEAATHSQPSGN